MLCAGSIRAKNCKNVLLWNLLDSCGGGIAFWAVGYAFAYGGDVQGGPKTFVGNTDFFLMYDNVDFAFWFFQFAFACAVSSIVAGTIAERCKVSGRLRSFRRTIWRFYAYKLLSHNCYFVIHSSADDRVSLLLLLSRWLCLPSGEFYLCLEFHLCLDLLQCLKANEIDCSVR